MDMKNATHQTRSQPKYKYVLRAVGYFLALAVVNTLAYRVVGRSLEPVTPEWLTILLENTAYLVGVLGLTWAFCHFIDRSSLRDLGLQKQRWFGKLAAGWGLGAFLQLLVFGTLLAAGWLIIERGTGSPIYLVASMVSWIIISFNEELSFRGYILQRLVPAWGMPAAVIVSSLAFAMVHVLNPNVQPLAILSIFFAGLLLATAYWVSGSLWLPIGLHIGWNLAEIHIFGFAGSGITEPALMRSVVHGPELVTGGAFGPEGGILGVVAPLIGIAILVVGYRIALARETQN